MKIFFDSVGCRLNQAEIEYLAAQFRAAGHEIINRPDDADLVVINTCSVTSAAASDSRQKARQALHAGARKIVLTGCWATLEPEQAAALPGVSHVINNNEKGNLVYKVLGCEIPVFDLEPLAREPLPGIHQRTRAFIKVQDGCDNFCTFCVTRLARGKSVSAVKEKILHEVQNAQNGGVHEIVLSGVHLGSWGKDLADGETITTLIQYLLDHTTVERIRLSSTEPWNLDEDFFDLWQNPRMCRHLHLPLQSGSESVLKRMARHTTPTKYAKLVECARKKIPGVAITTDLIAGFPGETDEEFFEGLKFVEQMEFSGGHVFKFSPREGTAAARMGGRIHGNLSKERAEKLRVVISQSEEKYLNSFLDRRLSVLWESSSKKVDSGWKLQGLSDNYIKVTTVAHDNRCNKFDSIQVIKKVGDLLEGEIE